MAKLSTFLSYFFIFAPLSALAQVTPEYMYGRVLSACQPPSLLKYADGRDFYKAAVEDATTRLPPRTFSEGESADWQAKEKLISELTLLTSIFGDQVEQVARAAQKKLNIQTIDFIRSEKLHMDSQLSVAISVNPINCKGWLNGIGYLDNFERMNTQTGDTISRAVDRFMAQITELAKKYGFN